jgi:hypothetical protein
METTERPTQHSLNTPEMFAQQWPRLRQQVKAWWDRLTDADLELVAGNKERLIRAIEGRYAYARERAEQEVERRLGEVYDMVGTARLGRLTEAATSAAHTVGRAGAFLPELPGGLSNLVRRYPVPSLMVGMGLGFLLGRTLARPGGTHPEDGRNQQSEGGYPDALIQCTRCGQMIRQADMVSHPVTCSGAGVPSHGGSTS